MPTNGSIGPIPATDAAIPTVPIGPMIMPTKDSISPVLVISPAPGAMPPAVAALISMGEPTVEPAFQQPIS